jgi:hypothetical protein
MDFSTASHAIFQQLKLPVNIRQGELFLNAEPEE